MSLKGPVERHGFDDVSEDDNPPGATPRIPFGGVDWADLEDGDEEGREGLRLASLLRDEPPWVTKASSLPPPVGLYVGQTYRAWRTSVDPPAATRNRALAGCLEAGHWFNLSYPELVGAVMEYELSWASPRWSRERWLTQGQDDLAEHGLGIGGTFGPAQFSPDTIVEIEREFIDRRAEIPNEIREHLLPLLGGDREMARKRSLDHHWARLYLAASIYLWELDNPNAPLLFVEKEWNPAGDNPRLNWKAPIASRRYREEWWERGPELLEKWRRRDRLRNR